MRNPVTRNGPTDAVTIIAFKAGFATDWHSAVRSARGLPSRVSIVACLASRSRRPSFMALMPLGIGMVFVISLILSDACLPFLHLRIRGD